MMELPYILKSLTDTMVTITYAASVDIFVLTFEVKMSYYQVSIACHK